LGRGEVRGKVERSGLGRGGRIGWDWTRVIEGFEMVARLVEI